MSSASVSTVVEPPADLTPARQWLALSVLLLAVLVIAIDNTVLGFAVPELSDALAPTGTELLWIVDSYAFVLAGLLVTMGNIGDRIGRRRLLMIGAAGFGAASTMAAFSTTPAMLIIARTLLGVAGATLMPSTLSLIRNIFGDADRRRVAIAIWASAFAVGSALGPILGGWLLERAWWGSVFLMALPVMAVLLVAGPRLLPESRMTDPGPFDWLSSPLSLAAIVPVVYTLKQAAEQGPSLALAGLAAAGLGVGVVFVRRQRGLPEPMLDVSLFRSRPFSTAVVTNLLANFAMIGALFFIAQYLQLVVGLGPFAAGLHLLPAMAAAMAASLGIVVLLRGGLPVAVLLSASLLTIAIGYVSLVNLGSDGDGRHVVITMVLIGSGVGAASSLGSNLVMAVVPARRAGSASAVSETAFELGAALGVAVLGSVISAVYRRSIDLPAGLEPGVRTSASDTISSAITASRDLGVGTADAVTVASQEAFATGIQVAGALGAVLLLAGAVAAARSLRHVDVAEPTADR
jgi:DHA2 family multidrug resistance protein-like MFS transporter